jgi:Fe-S-cluster-containing hydrogenase component 2
VGNIRLEAGRPEWGEACAGCFACLHWCPRGAVTLGGHDLGIRRYHHPAVRLADMVRRG